jgi:hypothetical protein
MVTREPEFVEWRVRVREIVRAATLGFLSLFNLALPDGLVDLHLVDGEIHGGHDLRDATEERQRKDSHEADLRLAELDHVVSNGRREEGGRDAEIVLHRRLSGKFVREDGGPLRGDLVRTSLRMSQIHDVSSGSMRGDTDHIADVGTLDQQRAE